MKQFDNWEICIISNSPISVYIGSMMRETLGHALKTSFYTIDDVLRSNVLTKGPQLIFFIPDPIDMLLINDIYCKEKMQSTIQYIYEWINKSITYISQFCNGNIYCFTVVALPSLIDNVTGNVYFPLTRQINMLLYDEWNNSVNFIDTEKVIAKSGLGSAFDEKNFYRWGLPYSKNAMRNISDEICKHFQIASGSTKKCVVLDCDNVLWGGTLVEDGLEGILIGEYGGGAYFSRFQSFVLNLYYCGVILAVCSKNDEENVRRVFREHSGMKLREENISLFMVNWECKASNLRKISDILNIGLDSIVFVDDEEYEINEVKNICPEVQCVLFSRKLNYEVFSCFNLRRADNAIIDERTKTYQSIAMREQERMKYSSDEDFFNSLNITLDIHDTLITEIGRLSELTFRMNKCTNGSRRSAGELKKALNKNGHYLYSVYLSDRFSNYGLIGIIEIENSTLITFGVSCRALGKKVEIAMIDFIKARHKIENIVYESTGKNEKMVEFLEQMRN